MSGASEDARIDEVAAKLDRTYAPHQQRVVEEKKELDEKIGKLQAFIVGKSFIWDQLSQEEQDRMVRQKQAMDVYSDILQARIDHF